MRAFKACWGYTFCRKYTGRSWRLIDRAVKLSHSLDLFIYFKTSCDFGLSIKACKEAEWVSWKRKRRWRQKEKWTRRKAERGEEEVEESEGGWLPRQREIGGETRQKGWGARGSYKKIRLESEVPVAKSCVKVWACLLGSGGEI